MLWGVTEGLRPGSRQVASVGGQRKGETCRRDGKDFRKREIVKVLKGEEQDFVGNSVYWGADGLAGELETVSY